MNKRSPLLLSAHLDTVKPCKRIRPVIRGKVIMTDGKSVLGADDKAGLAAIIETVQRVREARVDLASSEAVAFVKISWNACIRRCRMLVNSMAVYGIVSAVIGTGVRQPHTVEEHIRIADLVASTRLLYQVVTTWK